MNNLYACQHFWFSTAGTAVVNLLLSLFVFNQSIRSDLKKSFISYSLTICWWSTFLYLHSYIKNERSSFLFCGLLHAGAALIPAMFLNFLYHFFEIRSSGYKLVLRLAWLLSGVYSCISLFFPTWMFPRVVPKLCFPYYLNGTPLYFSWMILFFLITAFAHYVLLREYQKAELVKKKQLKYFFIANVLGYLGGIGDFFPVFNIFEFPFPYGNYGVIFFSVMTAYTIVRYRFFDIEVIVRKTLVFAGLLAFVFGVFGAATFLVQEVLYHLGAGKLWTYAISLSIIVLAYDPIRNLLINLTDKYLFQKKYDYQKLLKDATRGMSKIESLHHLLGLVVHFITMKMRVKNTAIMMRRRDNEFELGFQRGYSRNFLDYRLDDTNPMIMYLMREKEALDLDHVKEFIEAGNKKVVKGEKTPHEYDFEAIRLTMEELESSCVVPSFLGHDLRSILLVGEKKSGHLFSSDDITLLFTLAQESAIAIENAKLFDEAINKSNQLAKINEQLEYSRNLLMKALRETEIANKQLQDTQAQLIHEQKMATLGRLAASVGHEVNNPLTILSMNVSRAILKYRKNPDLKVAEVLELFQKMEQNIGRIKAVVNTLTGLLKKSEKGKFEPLSLKLILEETLPLVQFQTYLDNLSGTEVEFDIPGNTPLIRGDLERLQEVFLNLFINAYHAMQGRRNRRIRVTAELDTENPARVAVNFMDNGCGMTEEIMKKIFNYGFTTKPPGRGSGMGLYMCKYIVELHGGDMKVGSKVGEGTTFTIYLPAYEEGAGESGLRIEATS